MNIFIFILVSKLLLVLHYLQNQRDDKVNSWIIILGYFALFINYVMEYFEKEKQKKAKHNKEKFGSDGEEEKNNNRFTGEEKEDFGDGEEKEDFGDGEEEKHNNRFTGDDVNNEGFANKGKKKVGKKVEMNHAELIGYSLLLAYYIISVTNPEYKSRIHTYDYAPLVGLGIGVLRRLSQTNSVMLSNIEYLALAIFFGLYSMSHSQKSQYLAVGGATLSAGYYFTKLKL